MFEVEIPPLCNWCCLARFPEFCSSFHKVCGKSKGNSWGSKTLEDLTEECKGADPERQWAKALSNNNLFFIIIHFQKPLWLYFASKPEVLDLITCSWRVLKHRLATLVMVMVGAVNILWGYCVCTTLGINFKLSQGSGHANSMVLNPFTLIPYNKRVITPKVEHVHWIIYHHEFW